MSRLYEKFDKKNLEDDAAAKQTLFDSGIKRIVPGDEAFRELRARLAENNRSLVDEGEVSEELYNDLMQYIEEYRNGQGSESSVATAD